MINYMLFSALLSTTADVQGCSKFLQNPVVLQETHLYNAKTKVIASTNDSRSDGSIMCQINGVRESLTNTTVFSIEIKRSGAVNIVYDFAKEEEIAKNKYGDGAIITDTALAEVFLRIWTGKSSCTSPRIDVAMLLRDEWSLWVTCKYGDYQLWIGADGELRSFSGGLSGDVLPPSGSGKH